MLALLADEEMGGLKGAGWLVDTHPGLFEGCREAVGEAGGFSHQIDGDRRAYFVQIAEKGITWLRLVAHGQGGHGSLIHPGNPIARLAEALVRVQGYTAPYRAIDSTQTIVSAAAGRGQAGRSRTPRSTRSAHWDACSGPRCATPTALPG